MKIERVGFIGLGQMGKHMAFNLVKAGFPVIVYNRTKAAADDLVRNGAESASTPLDAGKRADVVVLSLPTPEIVKEIIFGESGVAGSLKEGKVIIDTSTIDPQSARDIEDTLKKKGILFLDAPVSGGPERAMDGTLTFMVGGDKKVFEDCDRIFRAMGKNIFYMGGSGSGQGTKLVNQILVSAHTAITAEAVQFGSELGLNMRDVIEVIKTSAGDSAMFRRTAPLMLSQEFKQGWQTYLIHKDLKLVQKTSSELRLPMIISASVI
ncbi:MAG: NAD(P)-dependent oxidoreductase, partial [Thaumarchaeota archaeon]|nr:NAD(P)-dependent oxidoreductase [Nitrososphaerota archaeon]